MMSHGKGNPRVYNRKILTLLLKVHSGHPYSKKEFKLKLVQRRPTEDDLVKREPIL